MRLIFLNKPPADSGGSSSFLSALAAELKSCGSEIVFGEAADDVRRQDVLLLNSWVTAYERALPYWKAGIPILLRLDGAARDYGRFDDADRKQGRIARLADEIVFQSEYCRRRLIERWDIVRKSGRIIYNGVDTALFSPVGERRMFPGDVKIAYVSHSTNFLKGFRHFVHLARELPHVTFVACTPPRDAGWPDEALGAMPPPANLLLLGRRSREELPAILRGCDIFASCSVNDPCPNSVIEAMACGLPVWYHSSGGTPELVGDAGIAFSEEHGSDLKNLLNNRESLSKNARERAENIFDIRQVARKYLDAAGEALVKRRKGGIRRSLVRRAIPPVLLFHRTPPLPRLRVAYFVPFDLAPYEKVGASTWIRCFQMMRPLSEAGIDVVINPEDTSQIDLAVIMRLESERGLQLAVSLKKAGVPYIFDMVVNYLDITPLPYNPSMRVTEEQRNYTMQLIRGATAVTAVSPWLADRASRLHPWTVAIPDAVPDAFFEVQKEESDFDRDRLRAVYVGYSTKCAHLLPWARELEKKNAELTIILEKEPPRELQGFLWKKWDFAGSANEIIQHEIGLAPRSNTENSYNKGHSSYKIASLMACGIPVIASPVPSYNPLISDGTAGLIVHNHTGFATALDELQSDRSLLKRMSLNARERVCPLAVSRVSETLAQVLRQTLCLAGK